MKQETRLKKDFINSIPYFCYDARYNLFYREIVFKFGNYTKNPPEPFINSIKFVGGKILNVTGYFTLNCPHCKYKKIMPVFDCDEKESFLYINDCNVQKLIRCFLFHLESKIRLSGCKKHMQMMFNLYGNSWSRERLQLWAKKSIFVSEQIKLFLNKQNNKNETRK